MKKSLVVSLSVVIMLFIGSGVVAATDQPNGDPFVAIWKAISELQSQITGISLTPGPQGPAGPIGPQGLQGVQGIIGPQGPAGKDGQDARIGAGNIAFTYRNNDGINVLMNNGQVWYSALSENQSSDWSGWMQRNEYNPPISPLNIADWKLNFYVDKNGDMWIRKFNFESMHLMDHYYAIADDCDSLFENIKIGQVFVASENYIATSASLLCYKIGNPGTMVVGIYETSNGLPNGTPLCSGIFDGNGVTINPIGEWIAVNFEVGVQLYSGVSYALVISGGGNYGANMLLWLSDGSSPNYIGGSMIRYDESGTWRVYDGEGNYVNYDKIFGIFDSESPSYEFVSIGSPPAS